MIAAAIADTRTAPAAVSFAIFANGFLLSHKIYHRFQRRIHKLQRQDQTKQQQTDAPLDRFNMKKSSGNGYRNHCQTVDLHISFFTDSGGFLQKHTQNFYSEDFFCCFRFCFFHYFVPDFIFSKKICLINTYSTIKTQNISDRPKRRNAEYFRTHICRTDNT